MIIIMGTIDCDPIQASDYAAHARLLIVETRKEPGCLEYALVAEDSVPGRFIASERWESEAALMAHMTSAHVAQFAAQTMPYLRGVNMSKFDATNQRPLV